MEEGRQAVSTGGNGFGIVGGIPHISRLVRQTGENGNGQAGGNIVFACRRYAHLAQQRVGETEGHPLLIQPPGGAGIGAGGCKGITAVIIQHFLYGNIEPLRAQDFLPLHVAFHRMTHEVVCQCLHFLHIILGGIQCRTSGQGIVFAGLSNVGLVNQLMEIDEGKLRAQHICHLLQTDKVTHITDGTSRPKPCGAEYAGLPQHLLHPQHLQEIQRLLPCAVGIALQTSGAGRCDQNGLHTLGARDGDDGLFRLLHKVDHQIGKPPHGPDHVNIHIILAPKHFVQNLRGHEEFLIPVDPDGLHDIKMRAGEVFRQFLMGPLDQLCICHVIKFLGQLEVLAHAAGPLKHIVMVQRHQNGTDIELYVFSEMDHRFFLLIYNL